MITAGENREKIKHCWTQTESREIKEEEEKEEEEEMRKVGF